MPATQPAPQSLPHPVCHHILLNRRYWPLLVHPVFTIVATVYMTALSRLSAEKSVLHFFSDRCMSEGDVLALPGRCTLINQPLTIYCIFMVLIPVTNILLLKYKTKTVLPYVLSLISLILSIMMAGTMFTNPTWI